MGQNGSKMRPSKGEFRQKGLKKGPKLENGLGDSQILQDFESVSSYLTIVNFVRDSTQ